MDIFRGKSYFIKKMFNIDEYSQLKTSLFLYLHCNRCCLLVSALWNKSALVDKKKTY